MAIRRWAVRPDYFDEQLGLERVSDEAMLQAYMEGASLQKLAGGVVTCIVYRQKTDIPDEMVTVSAIFEWKDRTDAKPVPEPVSEPLAAAPANGGGMPEQMPDLEAVAGALGMSVDELVMRMTTGGPVAAPAAVTVPVQQSAPAPGAGPRVIAAPGQAPDTDLPEPPPTVHADDKEPSPEVDESSVPEHLRTS